MLRKLKMVLCLIKRHKFLSDGRCWQQNEQKKNEAVAKVDKNLPKQQPYSFLTLIRLYVRVKI